MNTWLILRRGRYEIVYSVNKPILGLVIAKVGEPIWEFDPGYAINDTTYLKVIKGFKVDVTQNTFVYELKDRFGKLTDVESRNVSHIWPVLNGFWLWIFNNTNFHSQPD